jgi:hypothetical protein
MSPPSCETLRPCTPSPPGLPRLFVKYDPKVGPAMRLTLRAWLSGGWGPPRTIEAIVDSGATRSSIQEADADALGIGPSLRVPAGTVRYANGAEATLQAPKVPVAARLLDPATGSHWGPAFPLTPSLKPAGDRLLGTSDFFETFEVSFWPGGPGSRYSLVY